MKYRTPVLSILLICGFFGCPRAFQVESNLSNKSIDSISSKFILRPPINEFDISLMKDTGQILNYRDVKTLTSHWYSGNLYKKEYSISSFIHQDSIYLDPDSVVEYKMYRDFYRCFAIQTSTDSNGTQQFVWAIKYRGNEGCGFWAGMCVYVSHFSGNKCLGSIRVAEQSEAGEIGFVEELNMRSSINQNSEIKYVVQKTTTETDYSQDNEIEMVSKVDTTFIVSMNDG